MQLYIKLEDELIENNYPAIKSMSQKEKTGLIENISDEYRRLIFNHSLFFENNVNPNDIDVKIKITIIKDISRENTEIFLDVCDDEYYEINSGIEPVERSLNRLKSEIFNNFL